MSLESFDRVLKHVRKHYRLVSMVELARRLREHEPLTRCVALTFDDGHRDFVECAYPLLERYRVPATLYVVSEFVGQRIWLWSDAIHWMVHAAAAGSYRLELGRGAIDVTLDDAESRGALWNFLADYCLKVTSRERTSALDRFSAELGVHVPAQPVPEYAAATWDQIRSMDPQLICVGAHTRTHPILSLCGADEQRQEIEGCRADAENELQRPVEAFCYPNGRLCDFDGETLRILRRARFTSAVVSQDGLIARDADTLMLPRLGVEDCPKAFAARLDGVHEGYRRLRRHLRLEAPGPV